MQALLTKYQQSLPPWLTRLGLAGFLFFLAKGLLWLAVPWLAAVLLGA
ncbi:hypothetical protein [Mangrovimicrobium sediminis]|nr:hypothetical protein [Haliea sp. SAOS-164]